MRPFVGNRVRSTSGQNIGEAELPPDHTTRKGKHSDEFRDAEVYFYCAKKGDRIYGWNVIRRLLLDAGEPDAFELYIVRHREYFCVPYLARDPKKVENVDSRSADHAANAER